MQQNLSISADCDIVRRFRTEPWISEFERIFVTTASGIQGHEIAALRRVDCKQSRHEQR